MYCSMYIIMNVVVQNNFIINIFMYFTGVTVVGRPAGGSSQMQDLGLFDSTYSKDISNKVGQFDRLFYLFCMPFYQYLSMCSLFVCMSLSLIYHYNKNAFQNISMCFK